jgi:hypothetical protein
MQQWAVQYNRMQRLAAELDAAMGSRIGCSDGQQNWMQRWASDQNWMQRWTAELIPVLVAELDSAVIVTELDAAVSSRTGFSS